MRAENSIVFASLALAVFSPFAEAQVLSGCSVFPVDNVLNTRIDSLPVHPMSDAYVDQIGRSNPAHADFGAGLFAGSPELGVRKSERSLTGCSSRKQDGLNG